MTKRFIEYLQYSLHHNLPGESAHLPLMPLNRPLTSLALQQTTNIKESAVAIVLSKNQEHVLQLMLIQRSLYDGHHSGQVSFPGGKKDIKDIDLQHTAKRECYEETGIELSNAKLLGKLSEVYIPVSGFLIHPYVYFLDEYQKEVADIREVDEIFFLTIADLGQENIIKHKDIKISDGIALKDVPYFTFHNKTIWGATALILNEFRMIVLNHQRLT